MALVPPPGYIGYIEVDLQPDGWLLGLLVIASRTIESNNMMSPEKNIVFATGHPTKGFCHKRLGKKKQSKKLSEKARQALLVRAKESCKIVILSGEHT